MRSESRCRGFYCDRSDWTDDHEAMVSYFHTPHNQKILEQLLQYVQFEGRKKSKTEQDLRRKNICCDRILDHYDNENN